MAQYKNAQGQVLAIGSDMPSDGGIATQEEINTYNADPIRVNAAKWALVDKYESTLEITLLNGHKYAANKEARRNIREQIDNFSIDLTSITWIEDWGNFQTTPSELQQVLVEAISALRIYRTLVFGV